MIQESSQLAFKGGYHNKAMSVDTREFELDNQMHQFVHVYRKLPWLICMAGGQLKRAGQIIDDIRDKYAAVADADAEAAVEGAALDHAMAGAALDPTSRRAVQL